MNSSWNSSQAGSSFSVILPDHTSRLFAAHTSHWCVLTVTFAFSGRMLCPDSKNTSPLTAAHATPLGTLIISSSYVSCAWLRCWLAQLQLTGQTCNAHHTCTVPDPCNAELPICTRLCMGSINFCESFSYFDCLFLSSPRSSLRSFFFAATAVAFSSASLALVSALSAMAPGQDHNSAPPATLLPARHPHKRHHSSLLQWSHRNSDCRLNISKWKRSCQACVNRNC